MQIKRRIKNHPAVKQAQHELGDENIAQIAAAGEYFAEEVRRDIFERYGEKKLYEGGYLERRSERTPFAYRVKEEMLKLLKKNEAKV